MQVPRLPLQHVIGTCNGGQPSLHTCTQPASWCTVAGCTHQNTQLSACMQSHHTEVQSCTRTCTHLHLTQHLALPKCTDASGHARLHPYISSCNAPPCRSAHLCTRAHLSACLCNVFTYRSACIRNNTHPYMLACFLPSVSAHTWTRLRAHATSHHTKVLWDTDICTLVQYLTMQEVHKCAPEHTCRHACAVSSCTEAHASAHAQVCTHVQCLQHPEMHTCTLMQRLTITIQECMQAAECMHLHSCTSEHKERMWACTPCCLHCTEPVCTTPSLHACTRPHHAAVLSHPQRLAVQNKHSASTQQHHTGLKEEHHNPPSPPHTHPANYRLQVPQNR